MPGRALLLRGIKSDLFGRLLRLLEGADAGRRALLPVLTYHRVAEENEMTGYPGLISASPRQFDEQMAFLARHRHVISAEELLEIREGNRRPRAGSVMVTFDDAYRDFAEQAWPVLRRHGLPVTLFVPTAWPGRPDRGFWWDWLHAALQSASIGSILTTPAGSARITSDDDRSAVFRSLRSQIKSRNHDEAMALVADVAERQLGVPPPVGSVLDWPALRALAAEGVTLAPHSREHPLLDRIPEDRLDGELAGSRHDLQREIRFVPPVLAYPSGASSSKVRDAVARAGYRVAFTTRRGINDLAHADWLGLRRINVGRSSSLNAVRAQLGSWAVMWSR